jgi:hypothetical protein
MSFAKEYSKYAVHAADSGSNSKGAEGVNRDAFAFVPYTCRCERAASFGMSKPAVKQSGYLHCATALRLASGRFWAFVRPCPTNHRFSSPRLIESPRLDSVLPSSY